MKTTNVKPSDLNYDSYSSIVYDRDIRVSIPGHKELHKELIKMIIDFSNKHAIKKIADLGVGTGITSAMIMHAIPSAHLTAIDFSRNMLEGAKKRLAKYRVRYIKGDYATADFGNRFDVIASVIGMHHQNNAGKRKMFRKIYRNLNSGGIFVFGDLMTYDDEKKAALNDALHYAHLVKHAHSRKSLEEWAYHHKFLNEPATLENQIRWIKEAGFSKVNIMFQKYNTVLIVAEK